MNQSAPPHRTVPYVLVLAGPPKTVRQGQSECSTKPRQASKGKGCNKVEPPVRSCAWEQTLFTLTSQSARDSLSCMKLQYQSIIITCSDILLSSPPPPVPMAPLQSSRRLQVPQMPDYAPPPYMAPPFYSSNTFSCSTSHLSTILSSSTSDLDDSENSAACSPRTLYARSFDRPASARSLPSGKFRKNMKEMTGFGTTEEDFEALPIAIQRKVRLLARSVKGSARHPLL